MQLVSITTQAVLVADKFPLTTSVWEGKLPAAKTWNLLKATYIDADNQLERQLQSAWAGGPFFGGNANAATWLPPNTYMNQVIDGTLERLGRYIENLYLPTMVDKGFIERLVIQLENLSTNNTTLDMTNKNPVGNNKFLHKEVNAFKKKLWEKASDP